MDQMTAGENGAKSERQQKTNARTERHAAQLCKQMIN